MMDDQRRQRPRRTGARGASWLTAADLEAAERVLRTAGELEAIVDEWDECRDARVMNGKALRAIDTAADLLRASAAREAEAVANALVESKREWSAVVRASVEKEREECARTCESSARIWSDHRRSNAARLCARNIRARGETGGEEG